MSVSLLKPSCQKKARSHLDGYGPYLTRDSCFAADAQLDMRGCSTRP